MNTTWTLDFVARLKWLRNHEDMNLRATYPTALLFADPLSEIERLQREIARLEAQREHNPNQETP